ncbi:MAG: ABC transporter permease [Dermatophilaceae bacterium]
MTALLPTSPRSRLVGTSELWRLGWRRDRLLIPASVLGLVVLAVGSARATLDLYPDAGAATEDLAAVLGNPAVLALYGPLASQTVAALAVFKTVMLGAFLVSVLGFVVVRRHTRTEEEDGRLELVGAGVVGRWAPLAAAVALAVVAVLVASASSAVGLWAVGLDGRGSAAFGVAWAASGLATVGATAVAVQFAATARSAGLLGFGFLGAAYLLRAVADGSSSDAVRGLAWASPLGWAGRVEAYGADRLWVLALGVGTLLLGMAVALALLDRRDLGAGLLPARTGPARARRLLSGALGLVTRLSRGTVIGWVVGVLLGGVVVGSLLGSVGDLASDPAVTEILERLGGSAGTVEDIYLATEVRFVAAAVAGAGVAVVLRLAAAERAGVGELALSTATSRWRWYLAHVAVAVALTTGLLALLGVVVGVVGPRTSDAAPSFAESVGATLATLPAVWVVLGVAALLAGSSARFAPLAWGVLLLAFAVGELGPTMRLPEWVVDTSPFAHLSQLPGGTFDAVGALVLVAVASAAVAAGALAYRRRDAA